MLEPYQGTNDSGKKKRELVAATVKNDTKNDHTGKYFCFLLGLVFISKKGRKKDSRKEKREAVL
jgi:hypothetical protein